MATVNKDFKIKQGLVVEGTTATVAGNNILVEGTSDQYIINLIGGETLITSVNSTQLEVIDGELSVKSGVFDASGSADQALTDANSYTNQEITTALQTAQGYADTAESNAESYADGLASNYDPAGSASTAQTNAQNYADGLAVNYDAAGSATTAYNNAVSYADGLASNYDPAGSASTVQGNLDTHTQATSAHGVTGNIVGTSDTQSLSNKTITDSLHFQDGSSNYSAIYANEDDLKIDGSDDIILTTNSGDIILNPDGAAYIGSVSAENEIATHSYVDNAVSGLAWKQAVNLKVDTEINTAGNQVGAVFDGHGALTTADAGYRFLVVGQVTDASTNGLWEAFADGAALYFRRPSDADVYSELIGSAVYVMEGTQYGGTSWVQGNHYLTDFTGQTWTQFSGQGSVTAGDGIVVDGLEVSVDFTVVAEVQDLTDGLALKQDTLTASTGITIDGSNNISVTANTYDAFGAAATAEDNANSYTDTAVSTKANSADPTITGSLTLDGTGDFTITSDENIVIDANTTAYLNSATAGNEIATQGYVTTAIAGVTIDLSVAAGANIDWNESTEAFDVNVTDVITNGDIATNTSVASDITTAIDALDTDDIEEGETNLYFTDQKAVDALEAVVPDFTAVEINSVAKQVAATSGLVATASTVTAYSFDKVSYHSAKFLIKTAYGSHTELTEVLLTIDTADNVHITEYATIGTNGSSMTVTADVDGANVRLRITTLNNNSTVNVVGTLLA